jgi:putative transcriptional regulator
MDKELERFQADLLKSVRDMKAGAPTAAAVARAKVGLSQSASVALPGVSTRTLQEWEYGRQANPPGQRKPCCGSLRYARMHCGT